MANHALEHFLCWIVIRGVIWHSFWEIWAKVKNFMIHIKPPLVESTPSIYQFNTACTGYKRVSYLGTTSLWFIRYFAVKYLCLINFWLISSFFHYKVFTNENPLFCIIDTNSKEAFTYLDREPVNNVTYFEAMKTRHKAFIWPSSSMEPRKTTNESKDTHYRAGDAVLTFDKGQEISETNFLALISSKFFFLI